MEKTSKFAIPVFLVLVTIIVVFGVAWMMMSDSPTQVAVAPIATTPATDTTGAQSAPLVSQTGDPITDIIATVDAEGAGDGEIFTSATSDATLVASDGSELSALTSSYDETTF